MTNQQVKSLVDAIVVSEHAGALRPSREDLIWLDILRFSGNGGGLAIDRLSDAERKRVKALWKTQKPLRKAAARKLADEKQPRKIEKGGYLVWTKLN